MAAQTTEADIRYSAIALLAHREHSLQELRTKLQERFGNCAGIDSVLQSLQQQNLQSDHRFAAAFTNSRVARGQGVLRIRRELRLKGIGDQLIDETLATAAVDWQELAGEVAERKFGNLADLDKKPKARVYRFLQSRGFTYEQIDACLNRSA